MSTALNHYPPNWRQRLLEVVNAPVTDENLRFLRAWALAEGGDAEWNPLNTTISVPFFTAGDFNSSGVKNYSRATAGVCATALTLITSVYAPLLGALQGGKLTAEQIVDKCEAAIRTWGTNPDTIRNVLRALQ